MQPLENFATMLRREPSPLGQSPPQLELCSPEIASESARILLGCYRKGEAEDAEIYVRAIAAVFSGYPDAVARRIVDPRIGIAGQVQWLPTVAEVKHACEVEMAPIYAEMRREESRSKLQALPSPNDRSRRPTFEELRARYPDAVGHSQARIGPRNLSDAEKAKLLADLEARRAEFSGPLAVSDHLRAQNAARAKEIAEAKAASL